MDGNPQTPPPTASPTVTVLPAELAAHFSPIRRLGRGGEATVYLCRDDTGYLSAGAVYAVKVYEDVVPSYEIEFGSARFKSQFPVQHAVQLYIRGHDLGDDRHYDIMEYCSFGTLDDVLKALPQNRAESHQHAIEMVSQLAEALNGIQQPESSSHLVHGDLKPENILVRSLTPLDLVLSDFGLSVELTNRSRVSNNGRGTLSYSAPGALHSFSLPADWWSVGMIVFRILVGRGYFTTADGKHYNDAHILRELSEQDISLDGIDGLTHLSSDQRSRWTLLLTGLLTRKPEDRWGYRQVSEWLRGGSPATASSALRREAAEPQARTTATRPFVLPGAPEFRSLSSLAEWIGQNPDLFAQKLTGQRPDLMMQWVTAEFGAEWTFSAFNRSWDPQVKAAYLTSQIAPESSVVVARYSLDGPSDLLELASRAAHDSDAATAVNKLYTSGLIGALESEAREGFAAIDANWHDVVERTEGVIQQSGQSLDRVQTLEIRRQALAASAGARDEVVREVNNQIAERPAAMQTGWFRTMRGR